MPDRINLNPDSVRGIDIFPDVSDEIDRRIEHAEQRIKTWVLGGIAANLLVAILAAIPTIFYMGQMSRDISQTQTQVVTALASLKDMESRIQENTIWRARMEERIQDEESKSK
jgi:cell division protein ZapA (FtsZ GTPase activity inhibitor)